MQNSSAEVKMLIAPLLRRDISSASACGLACHSHTRLPTKKQTSVQDCRRKFLVLKRHGRFSQPVTHQVTLVDKQQHVLMARVLLDVLLQVAAARAQRIPCIQHLPATMQH